MSGPAMISAGPNPVVKRTKLNQYPGWTIREYADGSFDATGPGLSPMVGSFAAALAHVRSGR